MVIGGTLLIWAVKYLVRPLTVPEQPGNFLLGIAPNFIGSFLIPFGACWFFYGKDNMLAVIFSTRTKQGLRNVCVLGFLLLVINEYLQKVHFFGRTFDYYDILFSLLGLLLSYIVFARKLERQMYATV